MVTATFKTLGQACLYLCGTAPLAWPVGIIGALWYGVVILTQKAIREHREPKPAPPIDGTETGELWVFVCFLVLLLLLFTASVLEGLWIGTSYFLIFCLIFPVALLLAVVWDVVTIAFLGTQYMLLAAGSYSLHLMLLLYFMAYSILLRITPPALFAYRAILCQSSKLFVIRLPRYPNTGASNHNHLCDTCQNIVRNSQILLGAKWGFVWPFERHLHNTLTGLQNPASDCHLCSLLARSIAKDILNSYTLPTTQYGTFSAAEVKLKLRIWEQKSIAGASFIWAQINEKSLRGRPVLIEQISRGKKIDCDLFILR
jgi:hypothetical protein